ncbi:MAG: hypothetical protein JWN75_1189 [Candidatus Saccharibacteria bacterium]|nr:hypothetical protein [Candidatus Saccharibacteria bacterium]
MTDGRLLFTVATLTALLAVGLLWAANQGTRKRVVIPAVVSNMVIDKFN